MIENCTLKKKIKILEDNEQTLIRKCHSLSEVITELKEKQITSDAICEILKQESLKVPSAIFNRLLEKKDNPGSAKKEYPQELKSFAITLQFYSSRAYNYVRQTFDLCLPHEKTVRNWYSAVDAEPGFTAEAFSTLEKKGRE